MASKGPQAFRTISEVAEELDLPQHVLRFWETRFTQIRPMKRGGGRRYYRPDDVDLLRGIRYLLYGEGYTIRGVQRILKEHGPRFVIGATRGEAVGLSRPEVDQDEEDLEVTVAPEIENDVDAEDGDDDAEDDLDSEDADAEGHIEATFDPREFRPRPAPAANGGGRSEASNVLSPEEIRRLQGALSDLLELKRLLDQARG